MKFKYYKVSLNPSSDFFGKAFYKPIIPIKISKLNNSLQYAVLIDSGADFCIFDAEIGEYLGLDIKRASEIRFGGIQNIGGAKAYIHRVDIEIGGHKLETEVGFSYDISKNGYGILGQKGFFDSFVVKFDLNKNEIDLKPRR